MPRKTRTTRKKNKTPDLPLPPQSRPDLTLGALTDGLLRASEGAEREARTAIWSDTPDALIAFEAHLRDLQDYAERLPEVVNVERIREIRDDDRDLADLDATVAALEEEAAEWDKDASPRRTQDLIDGLSKTLHEVYALYRLAIADGGE